MSATESDMIEESAPSIPRGAHETFLGIGGVGFVVLMVALVSYGVYGERMTAGLDKACTEASLEAGRKLEAMGSNTQAIVKYRQALAGHIDDVEERNRCGLAIGDILFREGRYNEALEAYEVLPEPAFGHAGAYAGYVGALWQLGRTDDAARLSVAWLALALEEGNTEQEIWARQILFRVADSAGDREMALGHAKRLVEIDPDNDAALYVARDLQGQGNVEGARAQLEALIEASSNPAKKRVARDLLATFEAAQTAPDES